MNRTMLYNGGHEEEQYMRYHCLKCKSRFRETNEVILKQVTDEELIEWLGERKFIENTQGPQERF